jgi:hypothetical protein
LRQSFQHLVFVLFACSLAACATSNLSTEKTPPSVDSLNTVTQKSTALNDSLYPVARDTLQAMPIQAVPNQTVAKTDSLAKPLDTTRNVGQPPLKLLTQVVPKERPKPVPKLTAAERRRLDALKRQSLTTTLAPRFNVIPDSVLFALRPLDIGDDRFTRQLLDSLFYEKLKAEANEQLDTVVIYTAKDSVVYDLSMKTIKLYGAAKTTYQDFRLIAPEIELESERTILYARSRYDADGNPIENPKFEDRQGVYDAETMTYNFKTRRGKIKYVETTLDGGIYRGATIKRQETGVLNVQDAFYTTCNHPNPHYYFYCREMKLIPGDRVIARPVVLYIEDVPVFALPFAFFPTRTGRASGIIVPRYGRDNFKGWNLAQGGYYFAINDYVDARIVGDIGFRGSWRLGGALRYNKRYDFNGGIQAEFERLLFNESTDPDFSRSDRWNVALLHSQEFDPTMSLTASLNFVGGNQFSLQTFNPQNVLSQQATSNASFKKTFAEGQRSIDIGYTRTQDLRVTNIAQTVTLGLFQTRFSPFRGRKSAGTGLLEQLTIDPTFNANGSYSFTDTTQTSSATSNIGLSLTLTQALSSSFQFTASNNFRANVQYQNSPRFSGTSRQPNDERFGAQLDYPTTLQLGITRIGLNVSASLNTSTFLVDRTITRFFDPTTRRDSTVLTRGVTGFTTYSAALGVSTRLFGTAFTPFLEDFIGLKALRHTVSPNISVSFNPDFTRPEFGNFATYRDSVGRVQTYNRFEQSLFNSVPGAGQALNISLSNIFEAKVKILDTTKAADDPQRTEKNIQLFTLDARTGYNFAATQFNLSDLSLAIATTTLAPTVGLNGTATFSFYSFDSSGARINRYLWDDGRGFLRLTQASVQFQTGFSGQRQANPERQTFGDSTQTAQAAVGNALPTDLGGNRLGQNIDYDIPWQFSLSGNITANLDNPVQSPQVDATFQSSFNFSPTPNWKVQLSTGYSVRQRQFTAPQILVSRDFHCWEMSFSWVPTGVFSSVFFQINVKAPQLRDIRIERRDNPVNIFQPQQQF